MKRLLFIISCLLILSPGYTQKMKVGRIKKVNTETPAYFPSFGPGNKEIVFTGQQNQGLNILNIKSGELTQISDKRGAGSKVIVSSDKRIIYTLPGGTKENPVYKAYDPENKTSDDITSPLNNNPRVRGKNKKLVFTDAMNKTSEFAPLGDLFYIWPSVSPDGTKILFTAASKGSYVCDLNGNIIAELGKLNAPTWINDNWVLGMQDEDDGHVIESSEVIAIHIGSGKIVNLTTKSDEIALYPKASKDAKKVVFQNTEGEIFTARIRIKK